MYAAIKPLLFALSPETSHNISLSALRTSERLGITKLTLPQPVSDPVTVMGIRFPNRVGLAAGLDKSGDFFNALGALGFGFVEIGTVTPRAQPGNPLPRMFRLPEAQAIINRMGFNNKGVDHLVEQVKQRRYSGVLGINIGKNRDTAVGEAEQDYLLCMDKVYAHADYITINISSPNTPGLRELQFGDQLNQLLLAVAERKKFLSDQHQRNVPIAVKIAPDMELTELETVARLLTSHSIDAVIATNTTIDRSQVQHLPHADEQGGLSGGPLSHQSTDTIAALHRVLQDEIPIIGVGGIMTERDAVAKVEAGAALVQLYTGFIYAGPSLIRASALALSATTT
ncbi:MAG: quinone-dependent dihydroorotate dehydrogenase [Pseudomonadota bacterium]